MTKYFALLALLLASTSANAAGVFPSIIDGGTYDAVQNDLEFSVSGFMTDGVLAGNGAVSAGDSFLLFYELTSNTGNLSVVDGAGNGLGIVLSATADTDLGGSTFSLIANGVLSSALALTDLSGLAINSGVTAGALVSGDFSGLGPMNDLANFANALSGATVEALLEFGPIAEAGGIQTGGAVPTFSPSLIAGFTVAAKSAPLADTNFLPVSIAGIPLDAIGVAASSPTGGSIGVTTGAGVGVRVVTGTSTSVGAVNPIPEPASMLTLLGCVGGACAMGRRRRKAARAA